MGREKFREIFGKECPGLMEFYTKGQLSHLASESDTEDQQ